MGCIPPVVRQDPSDSLLCLAFPICKMGVSLLISGPSYHCDSWILCALSHGVMFLSTTWDVWTAPCRLCLGGGQLPLRAPGQGWTPPRWHFPPPLPLHHSHAQADVSAATVGPEGVSGLFSHPSLSAHPKSTGEGLFIYLCIYF